MRHEHPFRFAKRGLFVFVLASTRLWWACGSPDNAVSTADPGTIGGTITYDGDAVASGRPLAIAIYESFPPSGPPLATQLIERYELPFHYQFTGLRPGRYYVGALVDVDRMDTRYAGMLNRARDPFGYAGGGAPIEINARHGATGADITLEENVQ